MSGEFDEHYKYWFSAKTTLVSFDVRDVPPSCLTTRPLKWNDFVAGMKFSVAYSSRFNNIEVQNLIDKAR